MYSLLVISDKYWYQISDKYWYQNGKKHRIGFLPAVDYGDGEVEYWVNGFNYILTNGVLFLNSQAGSCVPRVIYKNGTREWGRRKGLTVQLNRKSGPAVIYANGDREYWVCGKRHGMTVISGKKYWFENGEFVKCIV